MKIPVLTQFRRQAQLMGSSFEFIVLDDDARGEQTIDKCIAEVKRIEDLLTEFSTSSQTSRVNAAAGKFPVNVDSEVFNLIARCKNISKITQGAFDISSGVLKKLYNFKGQSFDFPDFATIKNTLSLVGADKIKMSSPNKVYLTSEGMRISFAAVGKGYAADQVKAMLLQKEVQSGVINASGDLTAWGSRADGSPWRIGIANPSDPSKILFWIPIHNASVATSGDYVQFFERNGIRNGHTINPITGKPVTGIKSVTVVSPSAELSDALATAVFVMGVEVGLNFIEQLPNTHVVIINSRNKVFISSQLNVNKTYNHG